MKNSKFLLVILLIALYVRPVVSQQIFQNVASSMGIGGQTGLGHAVGWGDIDNDGDPDLGISNQEGDGFWFYRNDGDHFTEITASAGLSGLGGNKIIIAEMTGDEFNDLVLRTRSGTQYLFESNGDGTFNDITASVGIASAAVYNIADFNNDGFTDLVSVAGDDVSILYNNGDATFSEAEPIAPMPDFFGIAVLDYNRDGLMDVYWTTYGDNPNVLLKNNGDGSFTDVTAQAGVSYSLGAHALDVGDFNNDGLVDIYVGSYSNLSCKLFSNNGDGTFSDVTVVTGTQGHQDTRTTSFVDYNSDGWLDIFSSHHDFYTYSNTMQKSNGGETFEEVAPELGISGEFIGDYFGHAWADFNGDGAIDFFAAGHIDKYQLFKNNNCPGNWLMVDLEGVQSNPNGIGTQVDAWINGQRISRNLLPNGGFHDFGDLRLHFGLGEAASVDSIIAYWPSGIIQKSAAMDANQYIRIVEGSTITGIQPPALCCPGTTTISPNPASNEIEVSFSLSQSTNVRITLFNLSGQKMKTFLNETRNSGGHQLHENISELPNGIYFLVLQSRLSRQVQKLVVAH
jgi:hypothetical protein